MKRMVSLILALVMALSLCACGSSGGIPSDTENTENIGNTDGAAENVALSATFAELAEGGLVVLDDEVCKITITEAHSGWRDWAGERVGDKYINVINERKDGFTLMVTVENKLTDRSIGFEPDCAAVNKLSASTTVFYENEYIEGEEGDSLLNPFETFRFAEEVAAGTTASFEVVVSPYNTAVDGSKKMISPMLSVDDVTQLTVLFEIWMKTDEDKNSVHRSKPFTLYVESQEVATAFERAKQDSDIVLIDNEDVTVTAVADYPCDNMLLFIENKADDLSRQYLFDNQLFNGSLTPNETTAIYRNMTGGTCAYCEISPMISFGMLVNSSTITSWEATLSYYSDGHRNELPIALTSTQILSLWGNIYIYW